VLAAFVAMQDVVALVIGYRRAANAQWDEIPYWLVGLTSANSRVRNVRSTGDFMLQDLHGQV
jgi:hypothetical protein